MRYKGEWQFDKPHGKGKQTFTDGSFYKGNFVNGLKEDDNAVYQWPNGKVYKGPFKTGYIDGVGTLTMRNGRG